MRKLRGSAYSLIVIMAVMLVVIGMSLQFDYFASRLLPILVAGIVFIIAGTQLVKEIVTKTDIIKTGDGDDISLEEDTKVDRRSLLRVAAWITGFTAAIYLVGFIISIPLFVLFYMKKHGARWLTSAITAVVFTMIIYAVFEIALGVNLHPGLFLN